MIYKLPFKNNILLLGFGSIGVATLPLLFRHLDIRADQITILCKDKPNSDIAERLGVKVYVTEITESNFEKIIRDYLSADDLLINLTSEVDSLDLIRCTANNNILYIDTCIETWPNHTTSDRLTFESREKLLELKAEISEHAYTALSSCGANPGVVSLLIKKLLLMIASDTGMRISVPKTRVEWARLASDLGVRVIHVNERDTQHTDGKIMKDRFISTWSVNAMIAEAIQPAEMALGTHEKTVPKDAYVTGDKVSRAIAFNKSGKDVLLQTWLPCTGVQAGMVLNHNEPLSISDYLSISEDIQYAPTACFVYHPCEQTMNALRSVDIHNYRDFNDIPITDEIIEGRDELGVLVMTEKHGSYWLGSNLDIHKARELNAESSATSLQVAAGVIAGTCWIVQNKNLGVIEPEEIEPDFILNIVEPYWGGFCFSKTDWMPDEFDTEPFSIDSFRDN